MKRVSKERNHARLLAGVLGALVALGIVALPSAGVLPRWLSSPLTGGAAIGTVALPERPPPPKSSPPPPSPQPKPHPEPSGHGPQSRPPRGNPGSIQPLAPPGPAPAAAGSPPSASSGVGNPPAPHAARKGSPG